MMNFLRPRTSAAGVVLGGLALFVALGGTAVGDKPERGGDKAGATGQLAETVEQTAQLVLHREPADDEAGPAPIPGLTYTFTVPEGGEVYLETSGTIWAGDGESRTQDTCLSIRLLVDGNQVAAQPVMAPGSENWAMNHGNWSFGYAPDLAPGQHTATVEAKLPYSCSASDTALVDSFDQGPTGKLTTLVMHG